MEQTWKCPEDSRWSRSCCPMRSLRRRFIRILSNICVISALACLCLTIGCATRKNPERREVLSLAAAEDCFFCGGGTDPPWGQDNLGLLDLNTLEILPIEINRYDQAGALIEENTGLLSRRGTGEKEEGVSALVTVDADNGMAVLSCSFPGDGTLDVEKAAGRLCQGCLDKALAGDGPGVSVVDFATRDFRPLEEAVTGFGLGNYYVHCDWDGTGAELWVFYMPHRYL